MMWREREKRLFERTEDRKRGKRIRENALWRLSRLGCFHQWLVVGRDVERREVKE